MGSGAYLLALVALMKMLLLREILIMIITHEVHISEDVQMFRSQTNPQICLKKLLNETLLLVEVQNSHKTHESPKA